jgi:hypothetical protein
MKSADLLIRAAAARWAAVLLIALLATPGCKTIKPSNDRVWTPDQSILPTAEFRGELLKVHNVRHCDYRTDEDFTVRYDDRVYDLNELDSVDFIVCPFPEQPQVAHTMLSFGFEDGEQLAVSVEIRKELGEQYSPVDGALRQYELIYVVADERDVIRLRTDQWLQDVYLYPTKATPGQARELFVTVMRRVNKLAAEPEFYDTLTNNCTTNIVDHINELAPNRIPFDHRVLLPGLADEYAYDLGLIDSPDSFARTKRRAKINALAYRFRDAPDFSAKIRL